MADILYAIRELQRKFTITSTICTNTEGCPTSVSHDKEMILNGRITSAKKPFGIMLHTHCVPSRTLLHVVLQVALASNQCQHITSTYRGYSHDVMHCVTGHCPML